MFPIKVLIADDHTLFRQGLKWIFSLEKDVVVVGEVANGEEVAKAVEDRQPEVLLLDLQMPNRGVGEIISEVREKCPEIKVLILTAFSEEETILEVAQRGARGYVLKGVDCSTLIQAIKTVRGGGVWVDKEIPSTHAFEAIARASRTGSPPTPEVVGNGVRHEPKPA